MIRPKWKILTTVPGTNLAANHSLAYRNILLVKLEGTEYDPVDILDTVGNRQYRYIPGLGSFFFGSSFQFGPGAKLYILYN